MSHKTPTTKHTVPENVAKPQSEYLEPLVCSHQEIIPFAVVGSDQEYQVNGKRILGRKTKWGTIEGNAFGPDFLHST